MCAFFGVFPFHFLGGGGINDVPLVLSHCLPVGDYIVLKYSRIPQTVEYKVATVHRHRDYVIQIPISPRAMRGARRTVHDLKPRNHPVPGDQPIL